MIGRPNILSAIEQSFRVHPAVTLTGPRQCGKTTIARQMADAADETVHYFDMERLADQGKLANPELTLEPLRGLVIIDEIQRAPGKALPWSNASAR
jgi:predicted AAA+ superfamily ATPase